MVEYVNKFKLRGRVENLSGGGEWRSGGCREGEGEERVKRRAIFGLERKRSKKSLHRSLKTGDAEVFLSDAITWDPVGMGLA